MVTSGCGYLMPRQGITHGQQDCLPLIDTPLLLRRQDLYPYFPLITNELSITIQVLKG